MSGESPLPELTKSLRRYVETTHGLLDDIGKPVPIDEITLTSRTLYKKQLDVAKGNLEKAITATKRKIDSHYQLNDDNLGPHGTSPDFQRQMAAQRHRKTHGTGSG